MKRKIFAVIAGFLVSLGTLFIVDVLIPRDSYSVIGSVIAHARHALVGGLTAGYLIQRRGWIYGLLAAIMFETIGIGIFVRTHARTIYTGPITMPWLVFIWQYYILTPYHYVVMLWSNMYAFPIAALVSGATGGLLGQLLAQKWHKRSQRKPDAS